MGFYAAYRGWVRAKVACLRAEELPRAGRATSWSTPAGSPTLAERLSWRARRPMLMVVCGALREGKTRLGEALARVSGLAHLNSDVVRKAWPAFRRSAGPGAMPTPRRRAEDLPRARGTGRGGAPRWRCHRGRDVPAARPSRGVRSRLRRRGPGADLRGVPSRRHRGRRAGDSRLGDPGEASDATAAIAARQLAEFEALDEVEPHTHVMVRTDRECA